MFVVLDELFDGRLNYQTMRVMPKEDGKGGTVGGKDDIIDPFKKSKKKKKQGKDSKLPDGLEAFIERRVSARLQQVQEQDRVQAAIEEERKREMRIIRDKQLRKWGYELVAALAAKTKTGHGVLASEIGADGKMIARR